MRCSVQSWVSLAASGLGDLPSQVCNILSTVIETRPAVGTEELVDGREHRIRGVLPSRPALIENQMVAQTALLFSDQSSASESASLLNGKTDYLFGPRSAITSGVAEFPTLRKWRCCYTHAG